MALKVRSAKRNGIILSLERKMDMIEKVTEKELAPEENPMTQREMLRNDIREAEKQGLSLFELTGDGYNYKTIANTARDVIRNWCHETWQDVTKPFNDDHYHGMWLKSYQEGRPAFYEDPEYVDSYFFDKLCGLPNGWRSLAKEMFQIVQRKRPDRTHVYIRVNWKMPEERYQQGISRYKEIRAGGKTVKEYFDSLQDDSLLF